MMDIQQSSGMDTSTSTTVDWLTYKQTDTGKFKYVLNWNAGVSMYGGYDTDVLALAAKDAEIASRFGP